VIPVVPSFNLLADLDDVGDDLVRAISLALNRSAVTVLSTWNGCDKMTGDLPPRLEFTGDVNLEWLLRNGQFRLDLRVWGRGIPSTMTPARFARAVAIALAGPVLFSDCHVFPWSYLLAQADGAILHVVAQPNEEDRLDLLPEVPAFPGDRDYFSREILYGPADPLMEADPARGDRSIPPDYCAVFNRTCPKALKCARLSI
jgi:hypothetical protein